jgi:hypothetical protein
MKTQEKIVCSALVALLFVTNVYGAPGRYDYAGDAPKLSDKIKFGWGLGLGSGAESIFLGGSTQSSYVYADFFGEYKINNSIGVRLSLQPTTQINVRPNVSKIMPPGEAYSEEQVYYKIAPTLRVYMGKNKKFCFFLGPQMGYLASDEWKCQDDYGKEKILDMLAEKDLEKTNIKGRKLNRWANGFKFGWDYESEKGFIIGVLFGKEWAIGNRNTLNKASRSTSSSSNKNLDALWLEGIDLFYLGYNFAKLLD